jgi:hypothetical protein
MKTFFIHTTRTLQGKNTVRHKWTFSRSVMKQKKNLKPIFALSWHLTPRHFFTSPFFVLFVPHSKDWKIRNVFSNGSM